MVLQITFDTEQPRRLVEMGQKAHPWENELAPIKEKGEPMRYYLVETFSGGGLEANRKQAVVMARKINRRMDQVDPRNGWHAQAWPLPAKDGAPNLMPKAPFGCWVRFRGEPNPKRAPRKNPSKGSVA